MKHSLYPGGHGTILGRKALTWVQNNLSSAAASGMVLGSLGAYIHADTCTGGRLFMIFNRRTSIEDIQSPVLNAKGSSVERCRLACVEITTRLQTCGSITC